MAVPEYMRVHSAIKEQIVSKKYDVGAILPTEPELEKEFGVSRTTIRKATDMLAREGYISIRQGFGTQVISRKAVQNLNRFTSISESLAQKGKQIGLKSCYIEQIGAPKKIAELLGLAPGTPLICIHRIKTADGAPISITENYIPAHNVPGLEQQGDIPHLYQFLKERYGITYTGSRDIISACSASFEQAFMLGIEPKTALLSVRRVCFVGSKPAEVDTVHIIAELYEYEVFVGTGLQP